MRPCLHNVPGKKKGTKKLAATVYAVEIIKKNYIQMAIANLLKDSSLWEAPSNRKSGNA